MNFCCLLVAIALAVALTTTRVVGNPHARHARAVPAPAPKAAASVAGSTPAFTVPTMLSAIVVNIRLGTAPKTGVAPLDTFAGAVANATKINGQLTAKQLADFGAKAVASLSTATKATKANQAKLQAAVTNGLKTPAKRNVDGVIKIIGNNAKLLGDATVVKSVLQKLMAVNVAPVSMPSPASMVANSFGAASNIPQLANSANSQVAAQIAAQLAQGTKPYALDMTSILSTINQQNALPAGLLHGLNIPSMPNGFGADIQKQLAAQSSNPGVPDMSSLMNGFGGQFGGLQAGGAGASSAMFGNAFKG